VAPPSALEPTPTRIATPAQAVAAAREQAQAAADQAYALAEHARQGKGYSVFGVSPNERPVLIVTGSISDEVVSQMKEDLVVMDKLLGDDVARAGGGAVAPHAMGIKLMSLATMEPTYIEGLGAVFQYRVNMPLAGGEGGNGQTRPAAPPSAWDRAKRELAIRNTDGRIVKTWSTKIELPPYDPARVEELRQLILKTLPEAKNIRHLKDGDVVIVTIAGTDDAAKPVRMTFKAKKEHIVLAGNDGMAGEDFEHLVAQRVGRD
jgi:hypothetical protein